MKKLKRYRKGKRIYTNLDKQTRQVTVLSRKKAKKKGREAKISISSGGIEARMSDLSRVSASADEFVIDFYNSGRRQSGKTRLCARVITSPKSVKRLAKALSDSIRLFEQKKSV